MTTIFSFTSTEFLKVDQAGGKGLALMQMTAAGMPVPSGFVLTVQFFEPWIDRLQTSPAWVEITKSKNESIRQLAKKLQESCHNLRFNEEQKDELENALKTFRESNHGHLYAVRSSSP